MSLSLAERRIGAGAPALLVAEIGSNHDGDPARASALVDAAADAGADAVLFHSFRAARLVAARAATNGSETLARLARLELRTEWHAVLRERAVARGLLFLSTPFDEERATLLAALGVAALPVAAGDLTHLPLLRALGGFGRPILLGVAGAGRGDIDAALAAIGEGAGAPPRRPPVVLVAGPPAPDAEGADLAAVGRLDVRHECLVGWADQQTGHVLAVGAVARGAVLVVKRFTDDRGRRGAEHATSLDPIGFRAMADDVRALERALAGDLRALRAGPVAARHADGRGVHAARALAAGTVLAPDDLKIVRPARGAPPAALATLVGRRLLHACAADEPVDRDDVA